jgi:hypothetical protein
MKKDIKMQLTTLFVITQDGGEKLLGLYTSVELAQVAANEHLSECKGVLNGVQSYVYVPMSRLYEKLALYDKLA